MARQQQNLEKFILSAFLSPVNNKRGPVLVYLDSTRPVKNPTNLNNSAIIKKLKNVKFRKLILKAGPVVFHTPKAAVSECLESGHVFSLFCLRTIFLLLVYILGQADMRTGSTPLDLIFEE